MIQKRIVYPVSFTKLWNSFDEKYGKKGSKHSAYLQYKALKINDNDVDMILLPALQRQITEKWTCRKNGVWIENFVHVERWLKRRRWEDEISESINTETLPRSDQRKASAVERYLAKHMDDSVEPSGGSKASVGGTGQLDLGILESKS